MRTHRNWSGEGWCGGWCGAGGGGVACWAPPSGPKRTWPFAGVPGCACGLPAFCCCCWGLAGCSGSLAFAWSSSELESSSEELDDEDDDDSSSELELSSSELELSSSSSSSFFSSVFFFISSSFSFSFSAFFSFSFSLFFFFSVSFSFAFAFAFWSLSFSLFSAVLCLRGGCAPSTSVPSFLRFVFSGDLLCPFASPSRFCANVCGGACAATECEIRQATVQQSLARL